MNLNDEINEILIDYIGEPDTLNIREKMIDKLNNKLIEHGYSRMKFDIKVLDDGIKIISKDIKTRATFRNIFQEDEVVNE